jgi:hypothetical protein
LALGISNLDGHNGHMAIKREYSERTGEQVSELSIPVLDVLLGSPNYRNNTQPRTV